MSLSSSWPNVSNASGLMSKFAKRKFIFKSQSKASLPFIFSSGLRQVLCSSHNVTIIVRHFTAVFMKINLPILSGACKKLSMATHPLSVNIAKLYHLHR